MSKKSLSLNKIFCQIYGISHNELKFDKLNADSVAKSLVSLPSFVKIIAIILLKLFTVISKSH